MSEKPTCHGTASFTAAGLERELRDLRTSMEAMDQRIFAEITSIKEEISNIRVLAEHNKGQDKQREELKEEVKALSVQVASNKSFSDRALGGLGVLMAVVAIAEVFLLFKPPSAPPPLPLPAPVTELYPNAN